MIPDELLLELLREADHLDGLDVADDELLHHRRTRSWRILLPKVYAAGYAQARSERPVAD